VTATGKSPLAQRTSKKVRVLQETLYRAAKENPRRTFGVLYDKVCRWEVLWEAWYRVRRNRARREWMAELSRLSRRRERSRS
jgi:RNA-directed DNA polymerase